MPPGPSRPGARRRPSFELVRPPRGKAGGPAGIPTPCAPPYEGRSRLSVEFILDQIGRGLTVDEVVKEYGVPREDVLAAVRFAANTVGRDAYLAPER